MMQDSFLDRLSKYILEKYEGKTDDLTIVFPNKRAVIYLKKYLAKNSEKAIWLPEIVSVEDLFSQWLGYQTADQTAIVFELINLFIEENQVSAEGLDHFAGYAIQIVRDFEDIDHFLASASDLFAYLTEAKAIELWHPDGSDLSNYEKDYLNFFSSLAARYQQIHERMDQNKTASLGTISRKLAELPERDFEQLNIKPHVVFAGFNAFSPAETRIIEKLDRLGRVEVVWDFDTYYMDENQFGFHEAGYFARNFLKKHPQLHKFWVNNYLQNNNKTIHLIGVPGTIGQAKALGNQLTRSHQAVKSPENTAVVLADERLLFPVLNSVPDQIGKFNVTMGIPFPISPVYSLLILLAENDLNSRNKAPDLQFQLSRLIKILHHDFMAVILNQQIINDLQRLTQKIISDGNPYIRVSRIRERLSGADKRTQLLVDKIVFQSPESASDAIKKYLELIRWLADQPVKGEKTSNQVVLFNQLSLAVSLLNRMQQLMDKSGEMLDIKHLLRFLKQLSPSFQMNFLGEPLEGMQVMGLLETRNLDFETVHLLSANEGILPSDKNNQSLIPFDIRNTFGLPTYQENQAIYAYHFFHLLQRANDIFLYYNTEPDPLGGGEPSRFILQLKYELSKLNHKIAITEEIASFPLPTGEQSREISVAKTAIVMEQLAEKLMSGLSPTSIARYLTCPLKFYLIDILKTEESLSLDTSIKTNQLGTVIHQTLEALYSPFLNQQLLNNHYSYMFESMDKLLNDQFKTVFPGVLLDEGQNKVSYIVAKQLIKKLLETERNDTDTQITIVELEKKISKKFNYSGMSIILKGTIDRIDLADGHYRIIDYKTGRVEKKEIKLKETSELFEPEKSKALQLAIYTYLFLLENQTINDLPKAGIYALKQGSTGLQLTDFLMNDDKDVFMEFMQHNLSQLFEKMLDTSIPFRQTAEISHCRNCNFRRTCKRPKILH